jgi:hypothetical protein
MRTLVELLQGSSVDVVDRQDGELHRVHPVGPGATGVVFVHGVGTQPQSDTLRHFGGPLVDWLTEWHHARGYRMGLTGEGFGVEQSHLVLDEASQRPAWFMVDLPTITPESTAASTAGPGQAPPQASVNRWLLAEAWWSREIVAPGFIEMVKWSWHILFRAIGKLILAAWSEVRLRSGLLGLFARRVDAHTQVWPAGPVETRPGSLQLAIESLSAIALAIAYGIAGIAGYVVMVPLFVAAQVPVKAWQDFVVTKLLRTFLVDSAGDFKTYLDDSVQALNMRGRVERTIDWLITHGGCSDIVVIAHSQGAVVAFDALCGGGIENLSRVRKFITVGGALNKAWDLDRENLRIRGTLPGHIFWLDIWSPYDPVPGEQLNRSAAAGSAPIVSPDRATQERWHWHENYVTPGVTTMTTPSGPLPRRLYNRMNVLREHGEYWRNGEQFLSRIAQEIDMVGGYYKDSRFAFDDASQQQRVTRRRLRLTTLVGWRLGAISLLLSALAVRGLAGTLPHDGQVALDVVRPLGVGTVLDAFGTSVHNLVSNPVLAGASIAWISTAGRLPWESTLYFLIGSAFFALVFFLVYRVLTWGLFDPWDGAEAKAAIGPVLPPHHPRVLRRSIVVLGILAILFEIVISVP